jgi:hypothetical protein
MILGVVTLGVLSAVVDKLLNFPNPVHLELKPGESGARVSRRVVVVVVDGLSVEGSQVMPYLHSLRKAGADTIARTETPCYSRTGYTVLGTGTKPEVSGISSNDVVGRCPVDSVFQHAQSKGMKTALVGYAWWSEIFGPVFDHLSTESPWTLQDKELQEDPKAIKPSALPVGSVVRVLYKDGQYRSIEENWDSFVKRERLEDVFGNPSETPWNEDIKRGEEAARLLKRHGPDLLYVHLHSPDAWGHYTASNSSKEYIQGCVDADKSLRLIADQLDFNKDTLIVTADHGFTSTVKNAGHGGWEDDSSLIPVVMIGKGIKNGSQGTGFQLDVAATVSTLLGLPFTTHIQGEPLWSALDLSIPVKKSAVERWRLARLQFINAYSKKIELNMTAAQTVGSDAEWQSFMSAYQSARSQKTGLAIAVRSIAGLALFIVFSLGLWRSTKNPSLLRWLATYGAFELLFLGIHSGLLGVYSFSVAASGPELGQYILFMTLVSALLTLLATSIISKQHWQADLKQDLRALVAGALLKSTLFFAVVGIGPVLFIDHGLWLYGAIVGHMQTFILCSLLPIFVGPFLLLKRPTPAQSVN